MGKVFNVAGGPLGVFQAETEKDLANIKVELKAGYSNEYYLHDYFDLESVTITVKYADGTENTNPTNFVYYPAGPLDMDDEYITFKIVEGNRIAETRFHITVKDYQLVSVPFQISPLIYNGSVQFPNWSYDKSKVKIVDGNSGYSEAGYVYTTTFSLIDPTTTRWDVSENKDFFADQVIEWSIQKKPTSFRVIPPYSNGNGYTDEYTLILREATNDQAGGTSSLGFPNTYQFTVNYEGSPNGGDFVQDIQDGHIRFIYESGSTSKVEIRQYTNKVFTVSLPQGTSYEENEQAVFIIRANPDSFNNYEYQNDFKLTIRMYEPWDWGPEYSTEAVDDAWFEGLAEFIYINKGTISDSFTGRTKRVTLKEPVLGTTVHDIVCIGYDREIGNYGMKFQTLGTLEEPLIPDYSGLITPSAGEYPSTTFSIINKQYYENSDGKDYMVNVPTATQLGGYSNSSLQNTNEKVFTPAAYQLGLVTPNMDEAQSNINEPYQGDYNGSFSNQYFVSNTQRMKSTGQSVGNYVPYWTRSTAVKCVTSDISYQRNFIICTASGDYELVDAENLKGQQIYHAPMFKIGQLVVN